MFGCAGVDRTLAITHRHAVGVPPNLVGAADAWADATHAGLGGWVQLSSQQIVWFHVELCRNDLPTDWQWPAELNKATSPTRVDR